MMTTTGFLIYVLESEVLHESKRHWIHVIRSFSHGVANTFEKHGDVTPLHRSGVSAPASTSSAGEHWERTSHHRHSSIYTVQRPLTRSSTTCWCFSALNPTPARGMHAKAPNHILGNPTRPRHARSKFLRSDNTAHAPQNMQRGKRCPSDAIPLALG